MISVRRSGRAIRLASNIIANAALLSARQLAPHRLTWFWANDVNWRNRALSLIGIA
jgi:hypothetical protein